MMKQMTILIADDHVLVRDTICLCLEQEPAFVVATAADLDEALVMIDGNGGYDLVILDYLMPGMNGLTGLSRAITANAGRPVALMSGLARRPVVDKALELGAAGFLPKTMAAKTMINAVRFMAEGENYVPIDFIQNEAVSQGSSPLSKREHQVLQGICQGLANKEIAMELSIQEVTVKAHAKTLCKKLGARNRTHAAMIAKDMLLV
jgi:DNA-binding NarL/FixJ family response regulator